MGEYVKTFVAKRLAQRAELGEADTLVGNDFILQIS
jgi:hypothetical protein